MAMQEPQSSRTSFCESVLGLSPDSIHRPSLFPFPCNMAPFEIDPENDELDDLFNKFSILLESLTGGDSIQHQLFYLQWALAFIWTKCESCLATTNRNSSTNLSETEVCSTNVSSHIIEKFDEALKLTETLVADMKLELSTLIQTTIKDNLRTHLHKKCKKINLQQEAQTNFALQLQDLETFMLRELENHRSNLSTQLQLSFERTLGGFSVSLKDTIQSSLETLLTELEVNTQSEDQTYKQKEAISPIDANITSDIQKILIVKPKDYTKSVIDIMQELNCLSVFLESSLIDVKLRKYHLELHCSSIQVKSKLKQDLLRNSEFNQIAIAEDKKEPYLDLIIYGIPCRFSKHQIEYSISKTLGLQDSDFDILKSSTSVAPHFSNWVVRLPQLHAQTLLIQGNVRVGLSTYIVKQYVNIIRCFNCQEFGHIAKQCNNSQRCSNCGKQHSPKNCNFPSSCVNCNKSNREQNTSYDCHHSSFDVNCSTYQMIKSIELSKRNITPKVSTTVASEPPHAMYVQSSMQQQPSDVISVDYLTQKPVAASQPSTYVANHPAKVLYLQNSMQQQPSDVISVDPFTQYPVAAPQASITVANNPANIVYLQDSMQQQPSNVISVNPLTQYPMAASEASTTVAIDPANVVYVPGSILQQPSNIAVASLTQHPAAAPQVPRAVAIESASGAHLQNSMQQQPWNIIAGDHLTHHVASSSQVPNNHLIQYSTETSYPTYFYPPNPVVPSYFAYSPPSISTLQQDIEIDTQTDSDSQN